MSGFVAVMWAGIMVSLTVRYTNVAGREQQVAADKLLIATGRAPLMNNTGLKEVGGTVDQCGYITVNAMLHKEHSNTNTIAAKGGLTCLPMVQHVPVLPRCRLAVITLPRS